MPEHLRVFYAFPSFSTMFPGQRIFTKVHPDGSCTHNYAVPPAWKHMPKLALASKQLREQGCCDSFDDVVVRMAMSELPTHINPSDVYLDSEGTTRSPPRGQRFYAQPRACDANAVVRSVVSSMVEMVALAIVLDGRDTDKTLRAKVRSVRNSAITLSSGGGCPVRVSAVHSYVTRGNFVPFLNEYSVRDECASMPRVYVDVRENVDLSKLFRAHAKNLIRLVAVCKKKGFTKTMNPKVYVGRYFKKYDAPPMFVQALKGRFVGYSAACVTLEAVYRREVLFWQECDCGRMKEAFSGIPLTTKGELWDAHYQHVKSFCPWAKMHWQKKRKAVALMTSDTQKSYWRKLAADKLKSAPWLHRSLWKEYQSRPTKECSAESLAFAQICNVSRVGRLFPKEQVCAKHTAVLVTDTLSKYTEEELSMFAKVLYCGNAPASFPALNIGSYSSQPIPSECVQWCLAHSTVAVDKVPVPALAKQCIEKFIEFCEDQQNDLDAGTDTDDSDGERQAPAISAESAMWEKRIEQYRALLEWKLPLEQWCAYNDARGEANVYKVEQTTSGLVARLTWSDTLSENKRRRKN